LEKGSTSKNQNSQGNIIKIQLKPQKNLVTIKNIAPDPPENAKNAIFEENLKKLQKSFSRLAEDK